MSQHINRFLFTSGLVALTLSLLNAPAAHAQLTGFVNNPTTNSTDFNTFVTALGGVINTNLDFEGHPIGPLQSTFYLVSDGVTITTNQSGNQVAAGPGPSQSNTFSTPLSSGEGVHPNSNYLGFGVEEPNTVTFSFNSPISAFGLFTIDLFNPSNNSIISITAFDGQNGAGTQLGSFNSLAFNFQQDNLYFEGLADTVGANSISSVVVSRTTNGSGDISGLDNIRFARGSGVVAVPEAGTLALALPALGMVGTVIARRRKK